MPSRGMPLLSLIIAMVALGIMMRERGELSVKKIPKKSNINIKVTDSQKNIVP